jgi:hypothetical protein
MIRFKCLRTSCGYEAVLGKAPIKGCPKCKGYPIQTREIREENNMDWTQPREVSDLDVAFCHKAEQLLPPMKALPKCYHGWPNKRPSIKFVERWFYSGVEDPKFHPRKGVDTKKALRHIKACLGSFELKHEHKTAGVAFLVDQFFERIVTPKETYEFSIEED